MSMSDKRIIRLDEHIPQKVLIHPDEASVLARELKFEVVPCGGQTGEHPDEEGREFFEVDPGQHVGHFALETGTVFVIRPKIPAANVFMMLAYVYASWRPDLFREPDVSYEEDTLLFEPLVALFNELVARRVRHGLFQDYIRKEDNLKVLRGQLNVNGHVQHNADWHPDQVYCRFYENTCDVEDNQIVKWTLARLPLATSNFSVRTIRDLRANYHQFEPVTLVRPERTAFNRRHYHRLNEDYRLIHSLCRLFLDLSSINEMPGEIKFRGFLLDMNELFEKFVTEAFLRVTAGSEFDAHGQTPDYLTDDDSAFSVRIRPDIVITHRENTVSIVDAKYKRIEGIYENHDFYQVLSYGTALACNSTQLFYPATEEIAEGQLDIRNSPLKINIHRIDIEDRRCVDLMEDAARQVLSECSTSVPSVIS